MIGADDAGRGSPELEATLRRMVVVFRLLGLGWMLLVVIVTLTTDPPPRLPVVYGAVALGIGWSVITWHLSRTTPETLAAPGWFAFDAAAMLAIGAASVASGADELFHGGLPLSLVFVGALWKGLTGSLIAALLLAVEQFAVHVVADLNPVRAAGSILFFIVAAIVGWTFDRLRTDDLARGAVEAELRTERAELAAHEARVALVDTLHDSVLQTLHAIRMRADDPSEARYLARRQERELRRNIEEWRSEYDDSFRAALFALRDDLEDMHRLEIDAEIRDDAALTSGLQAGIDAAREALTNAAKHAGASRVSVFSEITDGMARIQVRDDGRGMGRARAEEVEHKLGQRVSSAGGTVSVASVSGHGTEVTIEVGA